MTGTIEDGEGMASYWLHKYSDLYQRWTGMALIPGSLNVRLETKFDWHDQEFESYKRIYSLTPYGGNRDICLIPCEITTIKNNTYGFIWATTRAVEDVDYQVLEIIASVHLRSALHLSNGSKVAIEVPRPWIRGARH